MDVSDCDSQVLDDHISCAKCKESKLQCYRAGCTYRTAAAPCCVDCCHCGMDQTAKLKLAAARTAIKLGI